MPTIGVVVVDDAEDLRMLVVKVLERDPRTRVLADVGDGAAGLRAVRAHRPDVVVMDVSMPVMDGLSATRQLKSEDPDLPVVIFTGYGDARVETEAKRAGADAFVEKTAELAELVEVVCRLGGARASASGQVGEAT